MAELQWYRKSEQVKEKSEPIIAKIGRFRLEIVEIQGTYYVQLRIMKYSGTYFLIDAEKATSLKDAMDLGEYLLKRIISIGLEKIPQNEKKSHSGETVKVLVDGEELTAIIQ